MAKGKSLQQNNAPAIAGIEIQDAEPFIEDAGLMLEAVLTPDDVAAKYNVSTAVIAAAFQDPAVLVAIKKKRVELVNSGAVMRKTALAALHKNKDRLDNFLSSDLNASSHATMANLAYRLSGLEAKDKRAEREASTGDTHSIIINLGINRATGEPAKTIKVEGHVRRHIYDDDAIDGEVISEDK